VDRYAQGMADLRQFTNEFTPEWADEETGIPACKITALAREMSKDKPSVIFHYGYRGATTPMRFTCEGPF
jgi:thiosulfate reductase/polysulfide reductase chain A